jgi:hypothetical protein
VNSGERITAYLLSLPERVLRSASALAGGLAREVTDVAIPAAVRRTHLYGSLIEGTLRFLIEEVGQVRGTYPTGDKLARNYLLRRGAGDGLEFIGILTFKASPIWVLAALADISGAGRQLIQEIADELRNEGLLEKGPHFENVEQLLTGLENSAGHAARTLRTPPLDVATLRLDWAAFRVQVNTIPALNIPTPDALWKSWKDLRQEAAAQHHTVFELSSLMALSAMRRTGKIFTGATLDYYGATLLEIRTAGFLNFWAREFHPYLKAAARQFSPRHRSLTQKLLRSTGILTCFVLLLLTTAAKRIKTQDQELAAEREATEHVTAGSLRGNLSFLSSDLLEGRNTPSRGLDIAAEFIASRFRAAGLEEIDGKSYFQTARMVRREPAADVDLKLIQNGKSLEIDPEDITARPVGRIDIQNARVVKLPQGAEAALAVIRPEDVHGAVVITDRASARSLPRERRAEVRRRAHDFRRQMAEWNAAALIIIDSRRNHAGASLSEEGSEPALTEITLTGASAQKFFEALPSGVTPVSATIRASAPKEERVVTRNVAGLLRGSDPELKNTYILVTAHYDHIGMKDGNDAGDRIYNGANDDGSGTVSVIELASALASLEVRPRRSIVFLTFFGEEEGLLGSKYYANHPLVPIAKTIAQINLEQVGRTDDNDGPQVGTMALTGFDYSDLHKILEAAGEKTGITVRRDPHGDDYFARSDNLSLARKGVVAHTVGVAFTFPDYHEVGDEWEKIDYGNMAKVDKALATALLMLANSSAPPRWNEASAKSAPFRLSTQPELSH